MSIYRTASVFVLVVSLTLVGQKAHASLTIDITQDGSGVLTVGSGTLNLTALTFSENITTEPGVRPYDALIIVGIPNVTASVSLYAGMTGPATLGPGVVAGAPSFGTGGDTFGIQGDTGLLEVPAGYATGSYLLTTDSYPGSTIRSLGLTPGTYTWTWGAGVNADSLTVQIVPAATATPEPSTAIAVVFGAVAFVTYGCYGWPRQRRAQRRQGAA